MGLATGFLFELKTSSDYEQAYETYQVRKRAETLSVETQVRSKLDHVFQCLRTISVLPSVRRISRHGENIEADAMVALREFYDGLARNLPASEITIVPVDFDPEAIDPVTGKPQEPILSVDEAVASGAAAKDGNAGGQNQEVKIFQFLQLRQHMGYLTSFYPTASQVAGSSLPLFSGPSVITNDNTDYNSTGRDADRMGVIFSVPFYGEDGALKGTISAVVRDNVLRDLLPTHHYALVNLTTGFVAGEAVSGLRTEDIGFYSALPIALQEPVGGWLLIAARPISEFFANREVAKIGEGRLICWGSSFALTACGMLCWAMVYGRKEKQMATWQALSSAAIEGLILVDGDVIVTANKSFKRMMGEGPGPARVSDILWDPSVSASLAGTDDEPVETTIRNNGGETVPVEIAVRNLGTRYARTTRVLAIRDLRERKEAQERMQFLAMHDPLTKLANVAKFRLQLDHAMARAARGESVAMLTLDLDHFKTVNDTLGHPVGDKLLQAVAAKLGSCVRGQDTVARIGGDEFVIIQAGVPQPHGATQLADRIIEAFGPLFVIDGHHIAIGVSVGIALAPEDSADAVTLVRHADLALYKAKSDGKGVCRLFEPELDAKMLTRRALEADLRRALTLEHFELFYQPIINAKSLQVSGFEALLRWRDPERGLVAPSEFIPLAEEMGLMGAIGAWVLQRGCCDAMAWPEHIWIAINVSPSQFKARKLGLDVASALAKSGLPAGRLRLEITEGVLLENTEMTLETLQDLRKLGIKIAMDDFGTGYSSLSYLSSFPFDAIKIDRSFVSGNVSSSHSEAVIRAVVGLGRSLGMSTTAEGVETVEQLERLKVDGCCELQGFLFSKPVPANQVDGLLGRSTALLTGKAA